MAFAPEPKSEFEALSPNAPATVENVLLAVVSLARYDETELADFAAQGRLRELFPFRLAADAPPDSLDEADVPEASPLPLSDEAYAKLLLAASETRGSRVAQTQLGLLKGLASFFHRDHNRT